MKKSLITIFGIMAFVGFSCSNKGESNTLENILVDLESPLQDNQRLIIIAHSDCSTCIYSKVESLVFQGCERVVIIRHPEVNFKIRDSKINNLLKHCESVIYSDKIDILKKLLKLTGEDKSPYVIIKEKGKYTSGIL